MSSICFVSIREPNKAWRDADYIFQERELSCHVLRGSCIQFKITILLTGQPARRFSFLISYLSKGFALFLNESWKSRRFWRCCMSVVNSNRIALVAIRIRSSTITSCSSGFTLVRWCIFPPVWKTSKLPTVVFFMATSATMRTSYYATRLSRVVLLIRFFLGNESNSIILCFPFLSRGKPLLFSDQSCIGFTKINRRVCSYIPRHTIPNQTSSKPIKNWCTFSSSLSFS